MKKKPDLTPCQMLEVAVLVCVLIPLGRLVRGPSKWKSKDPFDMYPDEDTDE